MARAIDKAIEKRIIVVLTTKAIEAEVRHVYDFEGSVFDVTNKGVLMENDYDSKKNRLKLVEK